MKTKLVVRWYHVAPAILALVLLGAWIAWRALEARRVAQAEASARAQQEAAEAETLEPPLPAGPPGAMAPVDFPRQAVTLFWPRADGGGLEEVEAEIFATQRVADRAKQVVELLLRGPRPPEAQDAAEAPAPEPGDDAELPYLPPLPAGTQLRAAFVDAHGTAYLSLSSELTKGMPGGSSWELSATYSIVNSLVRSLPEVDRVQFLIEGREVESLGGHLDARYPLAFNERVIAPPEGEEG